MKAVLPDPAFEALPQTAANRPALARIDYSPDDEVSLAARLLARLPRALPGWNGALVEDRTDYSVVLGALVARLGAILYAHIDHRANEGFLRTATLHRSIIDLCALVDYRPGAGASAAALQAFIAKPGMAGLLPKGFKLNATPLPFAADRADLVFETLAALEVDASRNRMRLSGYDRSGRTLHLSPSGDADQDAAAKLDAVYPGLKAAIPVVFDDGGILAAAPLAAAVEEAGATTIRWAKGSVSAQLEPRIADLVIHGRPKQAMRLAAAERADEISLGQNRLPVANAAMFGAGGAVLVDGGGLQMGAIVLAKEVTGPGPGGSITLNRGVVASLRRSATRVMEGTSCGATKATVRAGSTALHRDPLSNKKDFPHTPKPGDLLLVADAQGVEVATVASAAGPVIQLTQPIARALRPAPHPQDKTSRVRYYAVAPNDPSTHQSSLRPLLLGELSGIHAEGKTSLALDKAYDGLAPGAALALSDGLQTAALRVAEARAEDGKTVLTLEGSAPADLRVASLAIHGPFEHAMRVAGHDRSEQVLAAGASQLDIDGAPAGLAAGQSLVIDDGRHAEGARITLVQRLTDRTRIALAQPLEHAYGLADAVIYGNVAAVSHGASGADEVLGSGDPAAAPQRFALRRTPLAFLPDPAAPRGVSPAIEVWVGGQRWTRVDTLAGSGPADRHYALDIDDRQRAFVVFGDGSHGAPPASGRDNIVVRCRVGYGAAANVAAGAIARMPQPARFVERALNPMAASGGAERESPDAARRRAGHRVRTLDRAVSLADHAELALSYSGIAKARADMEREGPDGAGRRVLVVTCAPEGGSALSAPQKEAVLAYLASRSVEPVRLRVRGHRAWPVRLALRVELRGHFSRAALQRALLAAFGAGRLEGGGFGFFAFEARALGDDLRLSDVYARAEATEGVDHVLATRFHAEAGPARVADRISVPADAIATGGDSADPNVGRLTLQISGGLP